MTDRAVADRQGEQKKPEGTPWHAREAGEALEELDTDRERGLSAGEAKERLERYGPNTIESGEADPWWRILLRHRIGGDLRGCPAERDDRVHPGVSSPEGHHVACRDEYAQSPAIS